MINRLQESDIKLLRVFDAVATANGFTAAEPILRMQRPNISAAIKKLEERLELVLCHRGRSGFQMTKEGEMVYHQAKNVFHSFDNFITNVKSLHDNYSGHINLVLMAGLPNHVIDAVSKAIRSSLDKFDNINFNLHTRLIKDIEHVATSGESHLVVSCFPGEKPETLTFHPLMEQCSGRLYCSSSHPLAKYTNAFPSYIDIENYPAIGINGLIESQTVGERCGLSIETFSDSFETCMSGVMTGEYIGMLPDYLVESRANNGGLAPIGGSDMTFEFPFQIINGKNTLLNPVLKHVIRELTYFASELKKTA